MEIFQSCSEATVQRKQEQDICVIAHCVPRVTGKNMEKHIGIGLVLCQDLVQIKMRGSAS